MTLRLGGDGAITGCTSLENPDLTVSGLTISGSFDAEKVLVASGTAAAPSYTFSGDTDNGLYYAGTNQVAISTSGTGRLFVDNSGNVGIGTSSPDGLLHIASTAGLASSVISTTAGSDAEIEFRNTSGGNSTWAAGLDFSNSKSFNLAHAAAEGASLSTDSLLTVTTGGNVGIGTTSPDRKLHVAGDWIRVDDGYGLDTSGGTEKVKLDNGYIALTTNSSERMRIDSSGRVGIGSSSPGAKLTVQDGANAAGAILVGANYDSTGLTNNQTKLAPIHMPHYTNAEEKIRLISGYSDASQSIVAIGGGTNSANAATKVEIYTAADTTTTSGTAAITVDSSQRVGIGTTSPGSILDIHEPSNTAAIVRVYGARTSSGNNCFFSGFGSRGSTASPSSLQASDTIATFNANAHDGSNYLSGGRVRFGVESISTGSLNSNITFLTNDGTSEAERLRIQANGILNVPAVYTNTTASAANVFVDSNGKFFRSTSSIKYKTNVETLQDSYADAILNCRPVWYRSTSELDNPDYGWWGFIAEEVAEIDPRLVFWKTTEVTYDENGSAVESPCDPEPEGVAYDRFVPHLLNLIKRQKEQIEAMEARLSALEAS